jgi:hypothetical protein
MVSAIQNLRPLPGTYFKPGVISPVFTWLAKRADLAVAWYAYPCRLFSPQFIVFRYLDAHVLEGYTFLMQNYRKGDKICLFGTIRGSK